jgi:hypothetical protein
MRSFASGDRNWNPDSRAGEGILRRECLRRVDLWFFIGIALFIGLLLFIWQQDRALALADEIARLEARKEAMQIRILESGVKLTQLRQQAPLEGRIWADNEDMIDLTERVFVFAADLLDDAPQVAGGDTWFASVGIGAAAALASE